MSQLMSATSTVLSRLRTSFPHRVAEIFRPERRPISYDMLFKDPRDGCALYDDVWGG